MEHYDTRKGPIFLISSPTDVISILTSVIIIFLICFICFYYLSKFIFPVSKMLCDEIIIHVPLILLFLFSICLWDSSALPHIDIVCLLFWCKVSLVQTQHKYIYPFYRKWAFEVFLLWGYYKQWCYEHSFLYTLACTYLYFCRYIPRSDSNYKVQDMYISHFNRCWTIFQSLVSKLSTNFCCGNQPSQATLGYHSISPDKIISSNYNLGIVSIYGHL